MCRSYKGTRTLLAEAAMYGRVPSIAFLLSQGADDRIRDLNSYTPLQVACSRGHTGAAELLLREGNHRAITIATLDSQGNNALQIAIKAGHADTAHRLIQLNIFVSPSPISTHVST
jgi:ankyrin repeat protein